MPDVSLFDGRDLRRVLGTFVTGVTVVTTTDDEGGFHGVTANSFSSVSLDPPLVLWSQAVKTHSHLVFFNAERFAVNILAEDQIELSKRFAKSSQEKFAGIDVDIGSDGVPLLRGCSARLQCRVISRVPGGDHPANPVAPVDRARSDQRTQLRGVDGDALPGLHQHVDDGDVLEVAQVGHAHFHQAACRVHTGADL